MTEDLYIVGCGGFGREVHDVVDAINAIEPKWVLKGYVDDAPSEENVDLVRSRGFEVVGDVQTVVAQTAGHYVIGIGSGPVRRAIDQRFTDAGWTAATLMHPAATQGFDVRLGAGSVVCAGVRLTTNIRCGRHTHLNINTTIGHDVRMGDYVTVNPLVAVSGWVHLGNESMLGTKSAVLQNISVGVGSTVGAGAVVVRDVPEGVTVKGVPAR